MTQRRTTILAYVLTVLAVIGTVASCTGHAIQVFAAEALTICEGGDRAGRGLTCIVDSDTGWEDGVKWRLTRRDGGVDTPEISHAECSAEYALGERARDRLLGLMSGGYSIAMGEADRYGRALAVVTLSDGRDAGSVLIAEGMAQPWPNEGNIWCGR